MKHIPYRTIKKKRDGEELTREEIKAFIQGLQSGEVADYQATAFLMATYFQSMTLDETVALTEAMLESGARYDLSDLAGPKVDKHSTGGVGDKVSLILAPLAAACGLTVPMMSGRGLGHSGGTLDKLESIPGFDVNLTFEKFKQTLSKVNCAMIGQSASIAPADKKLYALRDVTGTVECIPLITASILSKKIAEGSDFLVLDVKVGNGAFMKTLDEARKLATTLIQVAWKMNLPCRALLTNMDQPLGYAVGNAIEVQESIEILKNERKENIGSSDLRSLTIELCAQMLHLTGKTQSLAAGRDAAETQLSNGNAWKVFEALVTEQNGDLDAIHKGLPLAPVEGKVLAPTSGTITQMATEELGLLLVEMGGGRKRASDRIDHQVGFAFHKKLGTQVQKGEPLVTFYANQTSDPNVLESRFLEAIQIGSNKDSLQKPIPQELILEQI